MRAPLLLMCLLTTGCFPNGEWVPTVWGGASIDDARDPGGAGTFATDDCSVTLDAFVVGINGGALLDELGDAAAVLPGDQMFDLVEPGPHSMAAVLIKRGLYPEIALITGPPDAMTDSIIGRGRLIGIDNAGSDANPIRGNADSPARDAMEAAGATALVWGELTCGDESLALDLRIDDELALLRCPTGDFELPGGSFGVTQLIPRPEALFADGPALLAADDGDGLLEMSDLEAAGLAAPLRLAYKDAWEGDGGACTWELAANL